MKKTLLMIFLTMGISQQTFSEECSVTTTFKNSSWRLISLPCDPQGKTVKELFGQAGFGETYGKDWILYMYDIESNTHKKLSINDIMEAGKGYWFNQMSGSDKLYTMTGEKINKNLKISIDSKGSKTWNLLGNPYAYGLKSSKVQWESEVSNTTLTWKEVASQKLIHAEIWVYKDGKYIKKNMSNPDTTIDPWDGFWIVTLENYSNNPVSLLTSTSTNPNLEKKPPIAGNWNLTFDEDFTSNILDPTKWKVGGHNLGTGGKAGTNNKNIILKNGSLILKADKTPVTFASKDYAYSTGTVSTFRKFQQKYGYFEARIKYKAEPGAWPAFWLMPDRGKDYGNVQRHKESFMRFNLNNQRKTVKKAILKVKVNSIAKITDNTSNVLYNISIHKVLSDDWNEKSITWNNKPSYDPIWVKQLSGAQHAVSQNQIDIGKVISIDVTSYINAQITQNKNSIGFALVDTFRKANNISLASKESTNEADRPRLEIDGQAVYPSDDAYVRSGSYASSNFGTHTTLDVENPWSALVTGTYDGGAEIDIFETQGIWGDEIQHAMHWFNDRWDKKRQSIHDKHVTLSSPAETYHTYGVYWEPNKISFYVDGIVTRVFENSNVPSVSEHIILTHYYGGWEQSGNGIIDDTKLPAEMQIDYVRVWSGYPK